MQINIESIQESLERFNESDATLLQELERAKKTVDQVPPPPPPHPSPSPSPSPSPTPTPTPTPNHNIFPIPNPNPSTRSNRQNNHNYKHNHHALLCAYWQWTATRSVSFFFVEPVLPGPPTSLPCSCHPLCSLAQAARREKIEDALQQTEVRLAWAIVDEAEGVVQNLREQAVTAKDTLSDVEATIRVSEQQQTEIRAQESAELLRLGAWPE